MKEECNKIIYNCNAIIYGEEQDTLLEQVLLYCFPNSIVMHLKYKDLDKIDFKIRTNNFKKLIFINYFCEYNEIIRNHCDIPSYFIFTKSLASLTNYYFRQMLFSILELKGYKNIKKIGVTDEGLYHVLSKTNKDVSFLRLIPSANRSEITVDTSNTIGLLNNDYDHMASFFNELSALTFFKDKQVKVLNPSKITKRFVKLFDIPLISCKTKEQVLTKNQVNLYINFTNSNLWLFFTSMDNQIPCILGNTNLFDEDLFLKEHLVMKSDDNIDEIEKRIKKVLRNKDEIFIQYQKFRNKYCDEAKNLVEEFLETKIIEHDSEVYEKLCTVIIPIYNVERYLDESLKSIIDAIQKTSLEKEFELLLINDGSKDDSGKIALQYANDYPTLCHYHEQKNSGLGNVRNVGLKLAKGKYISFIDSDDTVDENYFKDALSWLKKDIDIVVYDWLSTVEATNHTYETPAIEEVIKTDNMYKRLLYATIMPSACNKLIKKALFTTYNLSFAENLRYEDLSTIPIVFLQAKCIKYINKPYYHYRIRNNSIMHSKINLDMIDILSILENRLLGLDISDLEKAQFRFYIYFWRVEQYIFSPLYEIDENKEKVIHKVESEWKEINKTLYFNNPYMTKYFEKHSQIKKQIIERTEALNNNRLLSYIGNPRNNAMKLMAMDIYFEEQNIEK